MGTAMKSGDARDCRTLVSCTDWSKARLGPFESWPRSLRGYVSMVLDMPTAAIIFWGPDQTQIYNDAYGIIMGPRHPQYFGAPYRECWPDTYPVIHPWMQRVLGDGEVIQVEDTLFVLTRHGFTEEAYFTFTFSPLYDDDGAVAGIFQPVVEVTSAVLARRRAETLRRLAPTPNASNIVEEAFAALSMNGKDIPFALLYRRSDGDDSLGLAASCGLLDGGDAAVQAPPAVVREVLATGEPRTVDDVEALLGRPHTGSWPEPTRRALVLPIRRSASDPPGGVFVFGLSPRLALDDKYRDFFEAVARELAASFDAVEATRAQQELLVREQAARAEAEYERARLHSIFMQAPTAITILRGADYIVELANPLVCRL
ncbi:MAG TPA: GAF domain-containing protein, partial [Polyangia bacterium]